MAWMKDAAATAGLLAFIVCSFGLAVSRARKHRAYRGVQRGLRSRLRCPFVNRCVTAGKRGGCSVGGAPKEFVTATKNYPAIRVASVAAVWPGAKCVED